MFNISFLHKTGLKNNTPISIEGKSIRLVVGLGNPGEKYKNTYHNVGFLFIDSLMGNLQGSKEGRTPKWKNIRLFRYAKEGSVIFLKPTTFMNDSGRAVRSALDYFKVSPEETLIIHDDSDLKLGDYKISFDRGSAGHNGIESILQALGTTKFTRLRLGVRTGSRRAEEFVLGQIPKERLTRLKELFPEIQRLHFHRERK